MLWVALHFNAPLSGTLENLAAWACQFTPRVSLEPPQALLAEMQGALRCFSGLDSFLGKLPGEVAHAEGLLLAARRLLLQLEGLLTARQAGVRRFTLTLIHQKKKATEIHINLASPARSVDRLARLLRERLTTVSLREPVEAIRLEAVDFTPLHERSGALFGDAAADEESWAQLAERLRVRLGNGARPCLTTQPGHRPPPARRRVEQGEWDPPAIRPPRPRPAWLLRAPPRPRQMGRQPAARPRRPA